MQATFTPKTKDHVFKNAESFDKYIEELDPLDEFEVTKRDIDWGPFERECRECGEEFVTTHPATFYCEAHRKGSSLSPKDEEEDEHESKLNFTPKIKDCESCGRAFYATTPAMKYCEKCSPRGGELMDSN
jgi:hypothetical protein